MVDATEIIGGDNVDLTPDELEFLRKYRQLDNYDQGRVAQRINDLAKQQRKKQFRICDGGETMNKNSYAAHKADARQYAIEKQQWIAEHNVSYGELADIQDELYALARKFGLVREFRENGIL